MNLCKEKSNCSHTVPRHLDHQRQLQSAIAINSPYRPPPPPGGGGGGGRWRERRGSEPLLPATVIGIAKRRREWEQDQAQPASPKGKFT